MVLKLHYVSDSQLSMFYFHCIKKKQYIERPWFAYLVGGFNPSEKILVKMGIFPN